MVQHIIRFASNVAMEGVPSVHPITCHMRAHSTAGTTIHSLSRLKEITVSLRMKRSLMLQEAAHKITR